MAQVLHDVIREERDGVVATLTIDHPPANAIRKNSGNTIDGTRIAGFTSVLWIERQATARVTDRKRLIAGPASSPWPTGRAPVRSP